MRASRIKAMMYRDFIIFRNVKWKFVQFLYFPIATVLIWGLFAVFVKDLAAEAGLMVLVINVFWQFANLAQSNINTQMMEDIWSGSFKPVLVSGVTEMEYIVSRILSCSITASVVVALMLLIGTPFGLGAYYSNWAVFGYLIVLSLISSIALSILVTAMIIMLGREYGFLSWSALHVFILFSAPFYPVSIFPGFLQQVAWLMPFTSIFEAVRGLTTGNIEAGLLISGGIISFGYLIASFPIYLWVFRKARKKGWLVRLS